MTKFAQIPIADLESLRKAAERLGFTLDQNRKEAVYYGSARHKCDAVLTHPKTKYEIGLTFNEKKQSWELDADLYDSSLREVVGDQCGKLFQMYGVEAAKSKALQEGWDLQENWNPTTGEVKLRLFR
jgi:hypothetical protein